MSLIHTRTQCDQIGLLLKGLCKKFSYKSNPNIKLLLGLFRKILFLSKINIATFWANVEILGYFLLKHLVTLHAHT